MVELRKNAGKVLNEGVHEIGVIALGSHLENHGVALPIDTDIKIATYLALRACIETGAHIIGIANLACEKSYIKHGVHFSKEELLKEIKEIISRAKRIGIKKVVIVNAHGGNREIESDLKKLEKELDVKIKMNSKIVELEGAHAGTGELSVGYVIGIACRNEKNIKEHSNFEKYPEVGFVGLKEAWRNKKIKKLAERTLKNGIKIDEDFGRKIIDEALRSIIKDIKNFLKDS